MKTKHVKPQDIELMDFELEEPPAFRGYRVGRLTAGSGFATPWFEADVASEVADFLMDAIDWIEGWYWEDNYDLCFVLDPSDPNAEGYPRNRAGQVVDCVSAIDVDDGTRVRRLWPFDGYTWTVADRPSHGAKRGSTVGRRKSRGSVL